MKQSRFEDLTEALGAAIKVARKKAGLTQEDVAHDADLSLRHYQQIESGRMNATLKSLYDVATAVGVEVHMLFAMARRARVK